MESGMHFLFCELRREARSYRLFVLTGPLRHAWGGSCRGRSCLTSLLLPATLQRSRVCPVPAACSGDGCRYPFARQPCLHRRFGVRSRSSVCSTTGVYEGARAGLPYPKTSTHFWPLAVPCSGVGGAMIKWAFIPARYTASCSIHGNLRLSRWTAVATTLPAPPYPPWRNHHNGASC